MPLLLGLPPAMLPPHRACEVGAFHALRMHPDLGGKEEALGAPGRVNPYFLPQGPFFTPTRDLSRGGGTDRGVTARILQGLRKVGWAGWVPGSQSGSQPPTPAEGVLGAVFLAPPPHLQGVTGLQGVQGGFNSRF